MRDGKWFPYIFVLFIGIFGMRKVATVLFKCSGNRIIGNEKIIFSPLGNFSNSFVIVYSPLLIVD